MISTALPLTTSETDEAILAACDRSDGAIEDAEVLENEVRYFFESGATGVVNRIDGAVTIRQQRA